jgi:polyisoprenoid-binding protein YceI
MGNGIALALLASALLLSCEPAEVRAACELPPLQDPAKPRGVYRLDETKTLVRFDAKAFLHDFAGTTSRAQGTIRLTDLNQLSDAEVCLQIDAASLDTGNSVRDDTMRKDHLETSKYPTIDFRLKQVESVRSVAGGWDFTARGILSLHGVSREILVPIQARPAEGGVRITAKLPIKMSDYRIPIPKFLFVTVEDQVRLTFDLLARRAE